jgi:predicted esterase YcpF (UPF0227 family)
MKILYLHGFSSAPASHKAQRLRQALAPADFIIADYPSHQPRRAIAAIETILDSLTSDYPGKGIAVVGSSLGGYYAQYLASEYPQIDKVVMLNPALDPQPPLQSWIGKNTNMITGEPFTFSHEEWEQLADYDIDTARITTPTLLLVDEKDEVIDPTFAVNKYRSLPGKTVLYPGGHHSFAHLDEAIPEIKTFLSF